MNTQERLEYLRTELREERISYGELAELQSLVEHIDPSDVELLEAAGVPEDLVQDHPLMYKGWMIRYGNEYNQDKLCAYNFRTDVFINPLYKTWEALKMVIDEIEK